MKLGVKLVGLPDLQASLGADLATVELDGSTLGDLLRWLQRTHGAVARTRLIDSTGQLDPDIVVLRNGLQTIPSEALDAELSEGDQLTLLVVVAGG